MFACVCVCVCVFLSVSVCVCLCVLTKLLKSLAVVVLEVVQLQDFQSQPCLLLLKRRLLVTVYHSSLQYLVREFLSLALGFLQLYMYTKSRDTNRHPLVVVVHINLSNIYFWKPVFLPKGIHIMSCGSKCADSFMQYAAYVL